MRYFMSNNSYIMSNSLDNIPKNLTSWLMAFMLFTFLSILMGPITTHYSGLNINQSTIDVITWLKLLPQAIGIFFILKYAIASRQLRSNPKALRMMSDERELSVKHRSYSYGFIASMVAFGGFFMIHLIFTFIFKNNILSELNGIFVAGYILFVGYLTVYISYIMIQNE